jgi:hypothetical protein
MTRLRKVRELSADERWLLAQALVLLPLTFAGVYALGVGRSQRLLTRVARCGKRCYGNSLVSEMGSGKESKVFRGDEASAERASVIARIVQNAAYHGLYRVNCLPQALVVQFLLMRNDIESKVRFGARKEDGRLLAHAWVECQGIALNEAKDACKPFLPLDNAMSIRSSLTADPSD